MSRLIKEALASNDSPVLHGGEDENLAYKKAADILEQ